MVILIAGVDVKLDPSHMEIIRDILQKREIEVTNIHIIADEKAISLSIDYNDDLVVLQKELALILMRYKIDVAVLPDKNRRKKLLIADMDSTMIHQECIDELADFVGKKQEVAEITERAMRGELQFEDSLRERVACLKGMHLAKLKECYDSRIHFMEGSHELLKFMNDNHAFTALVSGGFTFFASLVAKELGFSAYRANELIVDGNGLAGQVQEPILGRWQKKQALLEFCQKNHIDINDTMAVGDGANDLDMLQAAGIGVAYHAKPAVADAARVAIRFADLTALIYLQS